MNGKKTIKHWISQEQKRFFKENKKPYFINFEMPFLLVKYEKYRRSFSYINVDVV